MNFAIYTAVSTEAQASPQKVSLTEQENLCRAHALAKGWRETAGPYIVPGESRTRWVNLRDAEEAIPPLKHMLDDAQHRRFDILIIYDYTRLRELIEPVAKTLAAYGVQLYALTQPVEPIPPAEYETNETASTLQFVASFTSRAEIAALKRRRKFGMPARVQRGLPPASIRYGYRRPPGREQDSQSHPIPDPITSAVVLKIKDLFLAGQSLWQIADSLTAEGIPSPKGKKKWRDAGVRSILRTAFYSGTVTYGNTRRLTDPRTGSVKTVFNPPSRTLTAQGQHPPLWDPITQARIDAEWKRRSHSYSGKRTNRLSNILYCGVCGSRCHVAYPGGYSHHARRWACSHDYSHVSRKDSELLPAFIQELTRTLAAIENPQLPAPDHQLPAVQSATLAELIIRRRRITDLYEAGGLDIAEHNRRTASLEEQIKTARRSIEESQNTAQRSAVRHSALKDFTSILSRIPAYITQAPPQEVNAHLRAIIHKINITPDSVSIELIP